MLSFGLSPFVQAIVSSVLFTSVLVLYLRRFAGSRWWLAVALGAFALDQCVKVFLLPGLRGRQIALLDGQVGLIYCENRAQGFGGDVGHLLLVTVLCVLALAVLYDRLTKTSYRMSALAQLGFALMVGGYLGILVDRLRLGFVLDFLELGKAGDFVYNIADLSVFAALALLLARGIKYLSEPATRERGLLGDILSERSAGEGVR